MTPETTNRPEGRSVSAAGGEDLSGFTPSRNLHRTLKPSNRAGRARIIQRSRHTQTASLITKLLIRDSLYECFPVRHLEPPCKRDPDKTESTPPDGKVKRAAGALNDRGTACHPSRSRFMISLQRTARGARSNAAPAHPRASAGASHEGSRDPEVATDIRCNTDHRSVTHTEWVGGTAIRRLGR